MDSSRFDTLTKQFAMRQSRRTLLRGMAGGLAAALGLGAQGISARQQRRPLCHVTSDPANPWVVISVAEASWDTHFAHGDSFYVDCCSDSDCPGELDTCGGGGTEGECGCTPVTCGENDCGDISDGCGGTLPCAPCCAQTGAACDSDSDCCGGLCIAAICRSGLSQTGGPCDVDDHCRNSTDACCDGQCRNLQIDHVNCGSCGHVCFERTGVCNAGGCECAEGTTLCEIDDRLECVPKSDAFTDHCRNRFQSCYNDPNIVRNCDECVSWTGCFGELDPGIEACGVINASCDDLN